jgi:hypothetical protein
MAAALSLFASSVATAASQGTVADGGNSSPPLAKHYGAWGLALIKNKIVVDWIWLGFVVGLALLMTGFLIGPRLPAEYQEPACVGNVHLPGPFGFELNCDSPEFMWLARQPSGLLAKNSPRQARPGLIIAAAILQAPLSLVVGYGGPPQPIGPGTHDTAGIISAFENNLPAYLAYVLLNVGILLASFFVLRRVIEREDDRRSIDRASSLTVLSTGFLLVANDVTKAFVWSPHTQLFNIFVPVLALYVTLKLLRGGLFDRYFVLGSGLVVGLGMITYPLFIVVTACAIPPAIMATIKERTRRGRAIAHLAALIALSAVPSLLWYAYVRTTTGAFFQFEMAQGEVVWMTKALATGIEPFLGQWFGNLWRLLGFTTPQAIPLAALIAWLAIFAQRHRAALRGANEIWAILAAALYVSITVLCFYTCVGWIVDRLAYPPIPPLIAAAGAVALVFSRQLPAAQRRELAAGFVIIALAQMVFVIFKDGPWS